MRRITASIVLASWLAACVQWEVPETAPQQVLAQEELPDPVHVTLFDGSWVVLQQPEISGDSLFGVVAEGEYRGRPLKQGYLTAVHVADVVQVAVEKQTVQATAGPLAGVLAVLGAVGYVQFLAWMKH